MPEKSANIRDTQQVKAEPILASAARGVLAVLAAAPALIAALLAKSGVWSVP